MAAIAARGNPATGSVLPIGAAAECELSVVVPTRNEAESVGPFVAALEEVLSRADAEVLFVDDSSDETPRVVEALARQATIRVRLCHRPVAERRGGLGGAVAVGFAVAQGRFVAVMDADLQHPPSLLRSLLAAAVVEDADVVVASRFVGHGSVGEFGVMRRLVSRGSSRLAKLLFPRQLRRVSDPMSGFFLVRRERIAVERLRPYGFKILLEVLVRSAPLRITEVPYAFGQRVAGESKARAREGLRYLVHLLRLRVAILNLRLIKFGLVGLSGLVINMALLALLTEFGGLFYLASAVIATETAIVWNFAFSECWVFRDRGNGARCNRFVAFVVVNNMAFAVGGPLLWLLVSGLGMNYLLGNFASITALMLARFVIADALIWPNAYTTSALAREAPKQQLRARVLGYVNAALS